ncbi:class I SAM-dependent methyltransferase [Microbacterium sp.]|uniref:class I SAM-dependent methyltransferase n=1 Tax=Microbacterium sp. TaxID=51671 RepID=UPI00281126BE|nr:class I SAM-dependent methyltransferase [Microbacterium sp.]
MSEQVAGAYDRRAEEYIDLFGSVDATSARDRVVIETWADGVRGPILDAGCGPGQWTHHVAGRREEPVAGVDCSRRFIASARRRFPGIDFIEGDLARLPFADGAFGGVLAWFSVIHTAPSEVPAILREFARVTRRDGSLLMGFFSGPDQEPFDHAVTTAWYWTSDALGRKLERAGFAVEWAVERHEARMRPQAEIIATRRGAAQRADSRQGASGCVRQPGNAYIRDLSAHNPESI